MAWVLVLDDSFTNADTSYGTANTNTAVPETPALGAAGGWYDRTGGKWKVLGDEAYSNDGGGDGHLYRNDAALADQRVDFFPDVPLAGAIAFHPEIAYSPSDGNFYRLNGGASLAGLYLGAYVADAFVRNVGNLSYDGPAFDATHNYSFRLERTLSGGVSTLAVTVTDTTASATFAHLSATTDTTAGLQRNGQTALFASSEHARYRRVQGYSTIAAPLAAGLVTVSATTPTTVSASCTAASGGTGPYTYQWHWHPTLAAFTPDGGTAIGGATSLSLTGFAPGTAAGAYGYLKVVATDTALATATTTACFASVAYPSIVLMSTGNSVTAQTNGVLQAALQALLPNRSITILDYGHSGATSLLWQAGSTYLNAALAAAASNGATHWCHWDAVNDASVANAVSKANYKARLQSLIAAVVPAAVPRIVLHDSWGVGPLQGSNGGWNDASEDLLKLYRDAQDELIDGKTVLKGDRYGRAYHMLHSNASYTPDDIHPQSPQGTADLTALLAASLVATLGLNGSGVVGTNPTLHPVRFRKGTG